MRKIHDGLAAIVGCEKVDINDFLGCVVVGCPMTSVEHLPLQDLSDRKITVISLAGERVFLRGITSTAEHTFGLILALMRNYRTALNPPYQNRDAYKGHRLKDKTLGIIGYGRIGKQVEMMAGAFGMNVMPVDNFEKKFIPTVLKTSDIVTIHIPLDGNSGFFTRAMFSKMKPTASFINTSRSGVVERGALLWALENKIIHSAAVDFIDEPELLRYATGNNNLILTNHIGGCTEEDMHSTEAFIENKVKLFLQAEGLIK